MVFFIQAYMYISTPLNQTKIFSFCYRQTQTDREYLYECGGDVLYTFIVFMWQYADHKLRKSLAWY